MILEITPAEGIFDYKISKSLKNILTNRKFRFTNTGKKHYLLSSPSSLELPF